MLARPTVACHAVSPFTLFHVLPHIATVDSAPSTASGRRHKGRRWGMVRQRLRGRTLGTRSDALALRPTGPGCHVQPLCQLVGRQRAAEVEALRRVAAQRFESLPDLTA